MPAVVVTGASTGIGRAIAQAAVRGEARVFASVRKQADAESLVAEFGASVTPLLFDVADEAAVAAGAAAVARALNGEPLFGLVNNAGIAVAGPLLDLTPADIRRQLEINLIGVHIVTRAFAPLLGADAARRVAKPGRIVMMSSVGGLNASPFTGAYSASKFALEGYAQALRRELLLFGVDVVVVGPGAIATPIWEKADQEDASRFAQSPWRDALEKTRAYMLKLGRGGLPAEDVGALVWRILNDPHPNTRYEILRGRFTNAMLPRLMPQRFVDRAIGRALGLLPKS